MGPRTTPCSCRRIVGATHQRSRLCINVRESDICRYQKSILRGPEELKELYDDYREKVGTMSKVVGGICTIDSVCPTKMACVGCGAKVPRPEFKEEITAFLNWADESEK